MNDKYNCIVICGPTASGKTKLAVQIARLMDGEILSADSRQVYRGMDVGTGKDLHEYGVAGQEDFVPYHLIDIAEPSRIYTLYDYQRDFYAAFEDVSARGRLPVVAGGSGLYIEAVVKGYDIPPVPENAEFRKTMMAEERETLIEMLRVESPEIFAKTDVSTKKRLVRALEVARFGGRVGINDNIDNGRVGINSNRVGIFDINNSQVENRVGINPDKVGIFDISNSQVENRVGINSGRVGINDNIDNGRVGIFHPDINPIILYAVWERGELRTRIERRLNERLAGGLIEEAARLLDSGVDAERFALFGMEYKHAARYIRGEVSHGEMAARLLQDIFHLAKRQDTWFRGMGRRGMTAHTAPRAELGAALRLLRG